ncbi:hypothetical protein FA09DRAFT_329130, partial [Tilletiopsis washingtonensis]
MFLGYGRALMATLPSSDSSCASAYEPQIELHQSSHLARTWQGLHPECVPSTFKEDLAKADFLDGDGALYEYAVETAACKAREVYERLVKQDGMNPPDLVIAADTIVLKDKVILEKPRDKVDQLRMLAELNDGERARAASNSV